MIMQYRVQPNRPYVWPFIKSRKKNQYQIVFQFKLNHRGFQIFKDSHQLCTRAGDVEQGKSQACVWLNSVGPQ